MKKYEVLEHTADAKFRAYGKSMEEAFENAAFAMVSLMYDVKMIAAEDIESFVVEGNDMEQLLYNFLEELLVLQDSKQFVMHGFVKGITITKVEGKFRLRAEVIGDKIKDEYEVHPLVKAMTYAEIEISEKPLYVQFVVDI
jgi:SHS2 domain-containing protein